MSFVHNSERGTWTKSALTDGDCTQKLK